MSGAGQFRLMIRRLHGQADWLAESGCQCSRSCDGESSTAAASVLRQYWHFLDGSAGHRHCCPDDVLYHEIIPLPPVQSYTRMLLVRGCTVATSLPSHSRQHFASVISFPIAHPFSLLTQVSLCLRRCTFYFFAGPIS